MKPILPKGAVAIKRLNEKRNIQSILAPPGSMILVISSDQAKNTIAGVSSQGTAPNINSSVVLSGKPTKKITLNSGNLSYKKVFGISDENSIYCSKNKPSFLLTSEETFERHKRISLPKDSKDELWIKVEDQYLPSDDSSFASNKKYDSHLFEVERQSSQPDENVAELPVYNISKHCNPNIASFNLQNKSVRSGSPPSYEYHLSTSRNFGQLNENSFISRSNRPKEFSTPPSYKEASYKSKLFPPSSSNIIDSFEHHQLSYNSINSELYNKDPSSIITNNHYYESVNLIKSYDQNKNPELCQGYTSERENIPYNSATVNYSEFDEKPKDYSYSAISNLFSKQESKDPDFIQRAKDEISFNKEENESSYEERRYIAKTLLSSIGNKTDRQKALREKFWIVEDEPLEKPLFLKNNSTKQNILDTLYLMPQNPKPPKDYVCHICGKILKGSSSLRSHVNLHLNIKPYKCSYCMKKFTQSSVLKNHVRIHTGETPYCCNKCGKSFKTSSTLRRHWTKHSKLRPFKCIVCSTGFKSKIGLQTHLKIHVIGPHVCRICHTLFDTRKALTTHTRRKHKEQRKFVCAMCNKAYEYKSLLKQHMSFHSNEKKHSCYVCGASYVWRSGLAAHLRTHSFKIQCEICGLKFISLKKLEKHRNKHSEPFPHKCGKCDKQFKFSYLLKKHFVKHKDELSCKDCGIGFISKTKLNKHLKTHNLQSNA